jgi:hypothetical protein
MNKKLNFFVIVFSIFTLGARGQTYFNAWLSSCGHVEGPSGSTEGMDLALNQARGLVSGAPPISWDGMFDVGDWTASQLPPDHPAGIEIADYYNTIFAEDRGKFFTTPGNHDGVPRSWAAGDLTEMYINPLGEAAHALTSGFTADQRPNVAGEYEQLLSYPGTRWDRYLVRTGNVIWIMLGDRNEFDSLAEARGDTSGLFQAGRGSAAGMPNGGYPSGAVTLDTFEWWRGVVEDPQFENSILITAHHLLPRNTTITTDDGEPGDYHGSSGSLGPNGEVGGQLYWIREYDESGTEIMQYAQTRPFLNYLADHPGAIDLYIGGHSHITEPDASINGRGLSGRKYGVSFISVGAITTSHGARNNQMTRLLTFQDGLNVAVLNIYIHRSLSGKSVGWYPGASKIIPLSQNFVSPTSTTNTPSPVEATGLPIIPELPEDPLGPRYYWDLDEDRTYDFNNNQFVIGADGSPYGAYENISDPTYVADSPLSSGKSFDFAQTNGRIAFNAPFVPEMNWQEMTFGVWVKTDSTDSGEVISYSASDSVGKFRFWFDGEAWIFEVGVDSLWTSAEWSSTEANDGEWHHFVGVVDSQRDLIRLYVDGEMKAEKAWEGDHLQEAPSCILAIGASGEEAGLAGMPATWSRSFSGQIDELVFYDNARYPGFSNLSDQVQAEGMIFDFEEGNGNATTTEGLSGTMADLDFINVNSAWVTPGVDNSNFALDFDGQTDRVIFNNDDMSSWAGIAVAAWVKTSDISEGRHRIISKDRIGTPGAFTLYSDEGNWGFGVYDGNDNSTDNSKWRFAISDGADTHDGEWHHIAGVADPQKDTITLYVDGVPVDTEDWYRGTINDSANEFLCVGGSSDPGSGNSQQGFKGQIDRVQVYEGTSNAVTAELSLGSTPQIENQPYRYDLYPDWDMLVDSNNSGFADLWESQYNISGGLVGSVDSDGDGQTNAEEAAAWTDPSEENDYFKTEHFLFVPNQNLYFLNWKSKPRVVYQLAVSDNLLNWDNFGGLYIGDGSVLQINILLPFAKNKSFYRIKIAGFDGNYDGVVDE